MISEMLKAGEQNATTSGELCRALNLHPRELTQQVQRERRAGKPICATSTGKGGYYLAETKEEMQRFCRALWHRAGEIHKTRRACMKSIDSLPAAQSEA